MTTEQDLTTTYRDGVPSADEIAYMEHSRPSGARKVVEVAPAFAQHATAPRTVDPIQSALTGVSASLALAARSAYRLISSVAMHFRMSNGTDTAVVTDIYLPANTALIVKTEDKWTHLNAIKATGASDGIVQATLVR